MPVTLRDIAKRLDLSHATVSFVLNDRRDVQIPETTRSRVRAMAQEMGYVPNRAARALVSGRTGLVALRVDDLTRPATALLAELLRRRAAAEGIGLLLESPSSPWRSDAALVLSDEGGVRVVYPDGGEEPLFDGAEPELIVEAALRAVVRTPTPALALA